MPFLLGHVRQQKKGIESQFGTSYNLPVFYLPQVMGMAMGMDKKEIGLNMNVVKTADLMRSLNLDT